ncbi:MAG: cobalamin-dependent protein [Spirochaetales bacterium]|nr:cobalamin-dependent protein [Spirochaetales bacterium]
MRINKKPTALLINPPVYDFALYDLFLKPYGLLRLAGMLERGGWDINVINALDYKDPDTVLAMGKVRRKNNGCGKIHRVNVDLPESLYGIKRRFARYGIIPDSFEQLIAKKRPDVVFISSGMTYWYKGVQEVVTISRKIWPEVPIAVGGIYASLMPEHCLNVCKPDFVSVGSSMEPLDSWLKAKGFPGLSVECQLPIDNPCWSDAGVLRLNEGCPLNCEYCASKKISPHFIPGSSEKAFNWLVGVNEKYGTSNFAFYDDALLVSSKNVFKPFLRSVIDYEKSTGQSFHFYTPNAMHINYLDEETAVLMKMAGFEEIRLGFESESEDFHSEYDGKYSESSFSRAIKYLCDAGFNLENIIVYILAGLPGQKASEVEDTIRFASSRGLTLSVSEFSTVPGSALWERCVKECHYPIAKEPLYHNNSFFPMEWEGFTREDMQRLKALSKHIM